MSLPIAPAQLWGPGRGDQHGGSYPPGDVRLMLADRLGNGDGALPVLLGVDLRCLQVAMA